MKQALTKFAAETSTENDVVLKRVWRDVSHAIQRNARPIVVRRSLHRLVDPSDKILIALDVERQHSKMAALPENCLVTVNQRLLRRDVQLTADDWLDLLCLGSFVQGRSAAHPTMFGQTDSAPTKLARTINHAFRGSHSVIG